MKKSIIFATIASAFTLCSCGSSPKATIASIGGEWAVAEVNGSALPASEQAPFIGFNTADGSVYGNAGCNSLIGSFDKNAQPGELDLSRVGSTRMMCADMAAEQAITTALSKVAGYKTDGDNLLLTDVAGATVIRLTSRSGKMKADALQGEWRIVKALEFTAVGITDEQPFIWFDTQESLAHGNTGCNSFDGSYTHGKEQSLKFGDMAVTMRLCGDERFERALMSALNSVASYGSLGNNHVGLFSDDGQLVIELSR